MVEQLARKEPADDLTGSERIPFPPVFPAAVIDDRPVEQQRGELKGGNGQREESDPDSPADAHGARFGIGHHRQQTNGQGSDITVDEMREKG